MSPTSQLPRITRSTRQPGLSFPLYEVLGRRERCPLGSEVQGPPCLLALIGMIVSGILHVMDLEGLPQGLGPGYRGLSYPGPTYKHTTGWIWPLPFLEMPTPLTSDSIAHGA
jgi:hypothetical protein